MSIDPQLEILRRAATGTLPTTVDSCSSVPALVIKDLVASGHLAAMDVSNFNGPAFLEPRITTVGREYLHVLEERAHAASLTGKVRKHVPAVFKWVFGIVAALVIAYLTKRFIG